MARIKFPLFLVLVMFLCEAKSQVNTAPSRFLIRFTDKAGTPHSINNPSTFLSARAINRRVVQGIPVGLQDLPPNPQYVDSLSAMGAQILNVSRWLNGVSVFTNDSNLINAIQNLSFVSGITPVRMPVHSSVNDKLDVHEVQMASRKIINPVDSFPQSYNYGPSLGQISMLNLETLHAQGYRGQGMLIAVLDAGFFNANILPAFDSLFADGRVVATKDFVDGGTNVYDDHTHGMNVLSVLAGNIPGGLIGSAPEASYLLLRTEDAGTEYLIEEFNWVVGAEYADSAGADIISSSLGYTTFDNSTMDHVYADLNGSTAIASKGAAWAASKGILVVNSAGNWGGSSWNYLGVPADADSIIATGAVDSMENLAGFSSRGPSADGRIKPDVSAQGVAVVMSNSSGGMMNGNGTSFSCPLISGAAACLWQANLTLSSMQVREAIIQSCDQYQNPDNDKGYGIPDFGQALFVLTGKSFTKPDADMFVSCYPNPADADLHVSLFSTREQDINLLLTDLTGRVVDFRMENGGTGTFHHYQIRMSDLSSGVYLLKAGFWNGDKVVKVVKR